ncbi:MAG: hypothetical protein WCI85_14610, partial [Comamonadaceae bacterium]
MPQTDYETSSEQGIHAKMSPTLMTFGHAKSLRLCEKSHGFFHTGEGSWRTPGGFFLRPKNRTKYQYDANGNRQGTDSGYTVASTGDNQMATGAGYTYQYDGEGNRVARWVNVNGGTETSPQPNDEQITTYKWDNRNRLVEVDTFDNYTDYSAATPSPTQVVKYSYDYANRWLGETVTTIGETTTVVQRRFVYDGNQIVLEFEKDATGDLVGSDLKHRDLWGAAVDQLLAQESVSGQNSSGSVLWALTDNLNTVRDLASSDGTTTTIAEHRIYDAFGVQTSPTASVVDCIFGYTARPTSKATGLQNNLNRWYE